MNRTGSYCAGAIGLGFLACLASGSNLTSPAISPLIVSRTVLRPGEWAYAWCHTPRQLLPLTLAPVGGGTAISCPEYSIGWIRDWWERDHRAGFTIPESTPPGVYEVLCRGLRQEVRITVEQIPKAASVSMLHPELGDAAKRIENALIKGDVVLAPGEYTVSRSIVFPPNRKMRGYGAVVLGQKPREPLFIPADRTTIVGLTMIPAGREWAFGRDGIHANNVTLSQCTIRNGSLGRWGNANAGLLVQDCLFDHAGAGPVMGGLFHRCKFDGFAPAHSFLAEGAAGPLGVFDVEFCGTDRGIILRNGWGPISDALFCGVVFRGVSKTTNGNELVLLEGVGDKAELQRLSFSHLRAYNCESNPINIDCPARDILFRDGVLEGGGAVIIGMNDKPVTELIIEQFEFRGGGAIFTKGASFCQLKSCAFVGWKPTRTNQTWWNPNRDKWYELKGRSVIEAQGPQRETNKAIDCTVMMQPDGVRPYSGITWR